MTPSTANPDQLRAIDATEGPLLIIAGPGSGKTFTLVERIVKLVTEKGVAPEKLLVVTFTDKAAQELVTRISNRLFQLGVRINLNEMYLGTLHSICLRWLEEYREFTRLKRSFQMFDQFDQQFFLYQKLDQFRALEDIELVIGKQQETPRWKASELLLRMVNLAAEEALEISNLLAAPEAEVRSLGRAVQMYHALLEAENAVDFSTIQLEALRLLRDHPQTLEELQAKIEYVMVDEYQDTNTIQEQILTLLAGTTSEANWCVVGDDDQGLYRFRGATIRNILEFPNKFPPDACQQVRLTTNYRSHPAIIAFYNRYMEAQNWVVDGQSFRFAKTIQPRAADFPAVPTVLRAGGSTAEAFHQDVLALLEGLKRAGTLEDFNQVAFLFRSVKGQKAVALSQFLEQHGVSVYSPRSNQFFERIEIRLMLGALIFLFPQFPQVREWAAGTSLEIWSYYDNDCVAAFASELRKAENADLLKWCRSKARTHLAMTENADYAFTGLFYELLQFKLFSQFLDNDLMHGGMQSTRAMRNLATLSQLLGKFEYLSNISVLTPDYLERNIRNLFNQFFRYLQDGGIDEYEDTQEYAPSGCVSFLTIHQSKGLEFPVVIVDSLESVPRQDKSALIALLEDKYYGRTPFEPRDLTKYFDFKRLYYTAFSRAQNLLVLACQENGQRSPSLYFRDTYNALPRWDAAGVKLKAVPLERVKDVNLKREYSFTSHLTVFENCAEQYRFFQELAFAPIRTSPILFGTLVHQTIEDIHKTVLRGEEAKLGEQQIESWFDSNYVYLTKRERVYLSAYVKRAALEHVLRYYRAQKKDWTNIREAEVAVSLVKDEYILTGKIDLIKGRDDTVEIVDFKAEKKPDVNHPDDREKLERYKRQLEVYAHIIEERYGLAVSKTHLYYTSEEAGNPRITWDKDERSLERTIKAFDGVVGRIERQDYGISDRPTKLCKNCDLRSYCDTKNWNFTGR
jgi:DNA helicase II / ATP-dependent DNA helicase PcrA